MTWHGVLWSKCTTLFFFIRVTHTWKLHHEILEQILVHQPANWTYSPAFALYFSMKCNFHAMQCSRYFFIVLSAYIYRSWDVTLWQALYMFWFPDFFILSTNQKSRKTYLLMNRSQFIISSILYILLNLYSFKCKLIPTRTDQLHWLLTTQST